MTALQPPPPLLLLVMVTSAVAEVLPTVLVRTTEYTPLASPAGTVAMTSVKLVDRIVSANTSPSLKSCTTRVPARLSPKIRTSMSLELLKLDGSTPPNSAGASSTTSS